MKNYKLALESIQKVKELVTGMSFDDAYYKLAGYNYDDHLFDFDYENISGTVWNEKGKAKIEDNALFDIIDDDWEHCDEPIRMGVTESELIEKIDWDSRINPEVRQIIENELIEGLNSNDIESVKYHIKTVISFIEFGCHAED